MLGLPDYFMERYPYAKLYAYFCKYNNIWYWIYGKIFYRGRPGAASVPSASRRERPLFIA